MTRRWYLVQIDIDTSKTININSSRPSSLHCYFLAKHPVDLNKSDTSSRWWPDWYRYTRDSISNNIVFGDQILFRPNISPNPGKYIQWGDSINFTVNGCLLLGQFNFEAISPINCTRCKVKMTLWKRLAEMCACQNMLGLTASSKAWQELSLCDHQ